MFKNLFLAILIISLPTVVLTGCDKDSPEVTIPEKPNNPENPDSPENPDNPRIRTIPRMMAWEML